MSHVVITCTCRTDERCPVPGHGFVPPDPVDPWVLAEAGKEAVAHLDDAIQSILKARAAWVSRGLPGDNHFPQSLDRLAGAMTRQYGKLRAWAVAAEMVAERRARQ